MPISQRTFQNRGAKVGTIVAMASIPANQQNAFILCDGRALNTYTYKRLHKTISNTYGGTAYLVNVTDLPTATTTFNIPDLRGRTIKGAVNMNDTANIVRYTGSETMSMDPHALASTEVPSHAHGGLDTRNYAYSVNESARNSQGGAVASYRVSISGSFLPDANSSELNPGGTSGHTHSEASTIQPSLVLNYYIQVF